VHLVTPPKPEFLQTVATRKANLAALCGDLLAETAEITLEIGCGHGHFLAAYAGIHPQETCVGIDIIGGRLERASRKGRLGKLANFLVIKGEAWEFIEAMPSRVTLASIYILFPDPWPKRRHWKNRLVSTRFLARLAERTKPGAPLRFRTDDPSYDQWSREELAASPDWIGPLDDPWPFERETVFQQKASSYRSWTAVRRNPATE
jgi:tRNA (guanine-N7-)-methyltransferase